MKTNNTYVITLTYKHLLVITPGQQPYKTTLGLYKMGFWMKGPNTLSMQQFNRKRFLAIICLFRKYSAKFPLIHMYKHRP